MRSLTMTKRINFAASLSSATRGRGFSLIELMIALVAGLIVLGATVTFAVSMLRSHTDNILATRLSQELRTAMALMSRELRRAGYDDSAALTIGRGVDVVSAFSQMTVTADCVIFAYDEAGGTAGTIDAGEVKGIRRTVRSGVGLVQYHPGGAAQPVCTADRGWEDITEPSSVDVTLLDFCFPRADGTCDLLAGAGSGTTEVPLLVRDLAIQLAGVVQGSDDVERALYSRIRIRSDCIRPDLDDCLLAPGATPAPPPTPTP
jgi:type IV pilus assembly protein PilW